MAEVEEVMIFMEELGRLFKDYEKCSDKKIKQLIMEDIILLEEAIDPRRYPR
ncbi:hypothetical protein [Mesobacillus zeae]|uniref:hypothetical protein n=1 Tax=Mesobacillus zeae TaxID=1917180 RepID=UPI0015E7D628|nr:hypothetical protein [Mesobacillus zeae]